MRRELCDLAPVFSDKIQSGDFVTLVYRSKKGTVKFQGTCVVYQNNGTSLFVEEYDKVKRHNGDYCHSVWVKAVDVYHGKHSLEWTGKMA